jgi:hypothetical protein
LDDLSSIEKVIVEETHDLDDEVNNQDYEASSS